MEDVYGRSAYQEGWGPHKPEDFAPVVGKTATNEVDLELVNPTQAVQQAMELHS